MKLPFFKNLETPLAWAQLSHQKVRLAVATTGVCFANILMFTQMGLLSMLTEGTTKLQESLAGDLFLVSSFSPTLRWGMSFPRSVMYQAGGIDGVASVSPIYIGSANWVNPQELSKTNDSKQEGEAFTNEVRIIAINPAQPPVFNLSEVNQQITKLNIPDTVLFDRFSQDSFGDITQLINGTQEVTTIMGNRRTHVVGLFNMGSSLSNNGNVIMSDWNYAQRSGGEKLDQVAIGVLRLDKGANLEAIQATLRANFPDNLGVGVFTRQELIVREQEFEMSEPNGVVLTFGTIVGFLVGVIIVYQVLYSDINDHLSEYATLKAMGYSDISLLNVIITEAIILGIMGFIPGFVASLGLYQLLASLTKIPLTMKLTVAIQVFILTQIMCALSGAIATNKLRSADPADVF
ncbi:MAG: ABC transporter permease DevC [Cyanobacteria bacterium J06632_19]